MHYMHSLPCTMPQKKKNGKNFELLNYYMFSAMTPSRIQRITLKSKPSYTHFNEFRLLILDEVGYLPLGAKNAKSLDIADEVCVYAKLPKGFYIPTPVGNYSPDWAIAFNDGYGIKHIYFIAETKGTMNSMNLQPVEQAKLDCAKKLFINISTSNVRYHNVTDYDTMIDIIKELN